jgi:hypothetical protein
MSNQRALIGPRMPLTFLPIQAWMQEVLLHRLMASL